MSNEDIIHKLTFKQIYAQLTSISSNLDKKVKFQWLFIIYVGINYVQI